MDQSFGSLYLNFDYPFEKSDFIFMLFKSKGSSGQKFVFSGPGVRDTWRHEGATHGSKWVHNFLDIWQQLYVLNWHLASFLTAAFLFIN